MKPVAARSIAALAILLAMTGAAPAQTSPHGPADAVVSAQRLAFLALADPERRAAQDALVWLGFYNGVADGAFGVRTRDAIAAFQASLGASADGMLSRPELAALLAAAQRAREAVGFQTLADPRTGARIGAPTKLLTARSGVKLEFAASADPDLGALYARLSASSPSRKVSYKATKPDAFFVVSGQDGGAKFYSRFEKNAAANPPIHGFTFSYPAAAAGALGAQFGQVAIAVANSFEAFPSPAASPAPGPAAAPEAAATALVIGPGRAVTALAAGDCARPTIAGKLVRFERTDSATGLAILAGDFASRGAPRRLAPRNRISSCSALPAPLSRRARRR